jgi:hypothetical protein
MVSEELDGESGFCNGNIQREDHWEVRYVICVYCSHLSVSMLIMISYFEDLLLFSMSNIRPFGPSPVRSVAGSSLGQGAAGGREGKVGSTLARYGSRVSLAVGEPSRREREAYVPSGSRGGGGGCQPERRET